MPNNEEQPNLQPSDVVVTSDASLIAEPDIDSAQPAVPGSTVAANEARFYEGQAKAEAVKRLRFENKQLRQDRKERRRYAHRIFCLICVWLGCVLLMTLMDGFSFFAFHLDQAILITAITTTTASVLGVFLIVANYLFPTPKKSDDKVNGLK